MKQFYIPILFAFLISATHSSEVQAQMWYPESRDYPGAKQEFVLSWCKSKNWLEK